jgi:hypothetical protein
LGISAEKSSVLMLNPIETIGPVFINTGVIVCKSSGKTFSHEAKLTQKAQQTISLIDQ